MLDSHSAQRTERSPARILWAQLLARIYEVIPLQWPQCGAEMRLIAFVTQAPAANTILRHLGEPASPPEVAPARGPRSGTRRPSPTRLTRQPPQANPKLRLKPSRGT